MTVDAAASRLIRIVQRKNRPSCVMLPGAGGGINPYLRLASFLGQTYNVYAIRAGGLLADEEPDRSVQEMTDAALDALDEANIVPDVLFGWSLGGVIAWEVCAGLAERGLSPDLVILDSSPLIRESTPEADGEIREILIRMLGPRADQQAVERVLYTFAAQVAALTVYETKRTYDGRVLLLLCTGDDIGDREAAAARWKALAADLSIGHLDADHFGVFDPEHLAALTGQIGPFLGVGQVDAA